MIIASNHISNSDPVLLGLSQKKRRLFFMAKIELFKNKFFGALIRALGAFPLKGVQVTARLSRQAKTLSVTARL